MSEIDKHHWIDSGGNADAKARMGIQVAGYITPKPASEMHRDTEAEAKGAASIDSLTDAMIADGHVESGIRLRTLQRENPASFQIYSWGPGDKVDAKKMNEFDRDELRRHAYERWYSTDGGRPGVAEPTWVRNHDEGIPMRYLDDLFLAEEDDESLTHVLHEIDKANHSK